MLCLAFFGGGATGRSPTEDLDGIDSSQPSCHGWSHFDLCSWQGHKNKEERKQLKVLKQGFSDMFDTHQKGSHPVDFIEVTNQYPISSLILRIIRHCGIFWSWIHPHTRHSRTTAACDDMCGSMWKQHARWTHFFAGNHAQSIPMDPFSAKRWTHFTQAKRPIRNVKGLVLGCNFVVLPFCCFFFFRAS